MARRYREVGLVDFVDLHVGDLKKETGYCKGSALEYIFIHRVVYIAFFWYNRDFQRA